MKKFTFRHYWDTTAWRMVIRTDTMPIPESKHYGSAEAVIAMLAYYIRRVQK